MSIPADPSHNLLIASRISAQASRRHRFPVWYAVLSTALFLLGVGVMTIGMFVGWFAPFLGAMLLTLNVVLFPLLLASWRARGVVPRSGRLVRSRYWRVAPIIVPLALVLGIVMLTLWQDQRMWTWVVVVVPFTFEHAFRLRAWTQR